ncbi:MAG: class I SAM-dependent methyltransferase [Pseudomonadota bacterium]
MSQGSRSQGSISSATVPTAPQLNRQQFDKLYDDLILGAGFFEEGNYYDLERERYWRSLVHFSTHPLGRARRVLEIGGGQLGIFAEQMLDCTALVADVSDDFRASVDKAGVPFEVCNLIEDDPQHWHSQFDAVALLEVIEHMPVPPYIILSKIRSWLAPGGMVFMTTPNLFRLRNMFRMIMGKDFTDHFMMPQPGKGLGHQHEYSAAHLEWQMSEAGYQDISILHAQMGQPGHSTKARLARKILSPLTMRPKWREGLVITGRNGPLPA